MSTTDTQYFATLPEDKIGPELMKRVDSYYEYFRNSGLYALCNFSHYQWNKAMVHRGKIMRVGNSLEYDLLQVNYYRNIGSHVINLTTSNRPTFKCKAVTTDASVQQQTKTADAIVEYYYRDKNYETAARRAAEYAWFLGEGYIYRPWNPYIGQVTGYKPVDPNYADESGPYSEGDVYEFESDEDIDYENFRPINEGDIQFVPLSIIDVIRDWSAFNYRQCDWKIVRTFVNRFKLAKEFPDLKDKILAIKPVDTQRVLRNLTTSVDSAFIPFYEFYQEDNDLVPGGRYIPFLSADVILPNTGLPYKSIPLDRMAEGEQENRPFGYSRAFDMLPIQVAYDRIRSIIISNQSTLGAQTFTAEEGSNVSYDQLAEGMNVMYHAAGFSPPVILEKLRTSPELFSSLEKLHKEMLDISGLNETAMGNPAGNVETFRGQALMNQLAMQNLTGFLNQYVKLLESSATGMIETLQQYAEAPRFAKIMGKDKAYMLKQWNRDDIKSVNLVIAELGSPAQRTPGYIQEIGEMMLKYNVPLDPNKFFQSLQYNNLDFMTAKTNNTEILIAQENEKLIEGIACVVSDYDVHPQHMQEHNDKLNDPEIRNNPTAIKALIGHVQEHDAKWAAAKPALLAAFAIPPYPAPPPPPPIPVTSIPHVVETTKIEG